MAKVLVIDDSPLLRTVLCDYLRDLGHEPVPAGTAREALRLCREQRPDLAIKDLLMEGLDPHLFLDDLRKIIPDLPVVICSTIARRQEICAAIRAGADDYLLKPFSRTELADLIRRHLRRPAAPAE